MGVERGRARALDGALEVVLDGHAEGGGMEADVVGRVVDAVARVRRAQVVQLRREILEPLARRRLVLELLLRHLRLVLLAERAHHRLALVPHGGHIRLGREARVRSGGGRHDGATEAEGASASAGGEVERGARTWRA